MFLFPTARSLQDHPEFSSLDEFEIESILARLRADVADH